MKKKKRVQTIDIIIGVLILSIIVFASLLIVNATSVVFELKGDKVIKLNIGEEFYDPGFIIKRGDEDLSSEVVVEDNININEEGTYKRTYKYGKKVLTREIRVGKFRVFTLNGETDVYILLNGKYDDPMVTAYLDGVDCSENVKVYNSCDMSRNGLCRISYLSPDLKKSLERRLHVSDFKDYFIVQYDSGGKFDSITASITMDSSKVSSYVLPDGTEKNENSTYSFSENGTYSFIIIDKYGNRLERKVEVTGIIKPLEVSCSAIVKNRETTISVTANKDINKYYYNGVEATDNPHKFNKQYRENKVTVIDKDNIKKTVTCKTTIEKYDSFGAYKHVIIIGVDGAGAAFSKVDSPNFDKIFGNYAFRHDGRSEDITISAQNWGSILTGVACKTHGFTNDSIAAKQRDSSSANHSIFYYVRKAYPDANLASIVHWNPINHGIIETDLNVKKQSSGSDKGVTNLVKSYLDSTKPTLLFIHFDEVDAAAHAHGGFSSEYYNKLKYIDGLVGEIYNKIVEKRMLDDTLLILVADHGETRGSHGGNSKEELSTVVAVRGHSVNKTRFTSGIRNRDVASIVLYGLGIKQPGNFISSVPSDLFGEQR